MNPRICDIELPNWLHEKLSQRYGDCYTINEVMTLLIEDYIARNEPELEPCKHLWGHFENDKYESCERCGTWGERVK